MVGFVTRTKEEDVSGIPYPDYPSEAIIALDTNNNLVIYQKNIHKVMLPASLTKVLTAILSIKLYNLDDFVIITDEMVNVEGSRVYLEVGDVVSIKDLIYGLMLCSGNDCAMALALHYSGILNDFMILMNNLAEEIGMRHSSFNNPHGLDEQNQNLTTAYDLAILFSYAMKNETFRLVTGSKTYQNTIYSERKVYFRNKHRLIHSDELVIGGKTGYTKKAKRTLITCFKKENTEIIIVTLNASSDWFIHQDLSKRIFQNLDN